MERLWKKVYFLFAALKKSRFFLKELELERLHFKNWGTSSNSGCASGSWNSSKSNETRKALYVSMYLSLYIYIFVYIPNQLS